MKVIWMKQLQQFGELEVPDDVDEAMQQQMAQDHVANVDLNPTQVDWVGTDFFSPNPGYEGDVPAMEQEDGSLKFYEWFDI